MIGSTRRPQADINRSIKADQHHHYIQNNAINKARTGYTHTSRHRVTRLHFSFKTFLIVHIQSLHKTITKHADIHSAGTG